jgi:hypothetical protein
MGECDPGGIFRRPSQDPQIVTFGRQKQMRERRGFFQPTFHVIGLTGPGGDDGGVKKKPRVFRAFGQRVFHGPLRFRNVSRRRQRPGERIVAENVLAVIQFAPGQLKCGFRRLAARGEKQRK